MHFKIPSPTNQPPTHVHHKRNPNLRIQSLGIPSIPKSKIWAAKLAKPAKPAKLTS